MAPWIDEEGDQRGIKSYFQCEYHDSIVDTGWGGEWIFQYRQPLSVFPGVKGRDFIPSLILKRKWDFANGFFDQYQDYPPSKELLIRREGKGHVNPNSVKGKRFRGAYVEPPPPPSGRAPRSAFVEPARAGRSAIFALGRRSSDLQAAAVGAAAGTTVTVGLPAAAAAATGAS